MRRKPQEIDFEEEASVERARIEAQIGQEVPISLRYCLGPRPRLIAIDGDFALLQFPNGAVLKKVPLGDLWVTTQQPLTLNGLGWDRFVKGVSAIPNGQE